jgi:hypothetical protein
MTQRVWKYAIAPTSATQVIIMPRAAKPLRFGTVDDQMFLWALVDDEAELGVASFVVIYTGAQVPNRGAEYVGTTNLGTYVLHLFQLTEYTAPQAA